mmetsp:Transcript_9083/g.19482  ORF Transcript_9083/g.19482 Transcript_9083/m.19482 type:complete len:289 (+) Transcript_9083:286-1152(+)|eukprot:CAMPEP_0178483262 /NCGR_PEP_ID=MMETSP0696-20121128/7144_1 /TAXON_ID=265572 /ORGANISM="Extubocellulus spinifer, Strain CCMP396" /LENGTH=288 /DNA_ID=CAMNT_0020110775 /DNA_START=235 /DNA_END=1101 /DNA_ORIENTATION=+
MTDRRAQQQRMSWLLDGCTVAGVSAFVHSYPSWINPWELTPLQWVVGFTLIRGAITIYDHLVIFLVDCSNAKLLPTRTTGKPVRYVDLDRTSYVFLTINSLNEWVFVQRLCHFLWHADTIPKSLDEVGVANTLAALYVMFVVLDVCYAPCHHILHMPSIYPLIHKHHHRQHYPTRGYLDAGNEHPIEHMIGTLCTWAAVLVAAYTTGAHALTIFLFFNVHAALAMLNHSPYDVEFGALGIRYSVANHEMHHRKFIVNYAQYCMWYDHVAHTFADYEGPSDKQALKRAA